MMKKIIYSFLVLFLLNSNAVAQTLSISLNPESSAGNNANVTSSSPSSNDMNSQLITFGSDGTVNERALLRFVLSSLPPGTDIISAKLKLMGVSHKTVYPGAGVLQMIPETWGSTLNYSISQSFKNTGTIIMPTVSISSPTAVTQNYQLDVTSMVQTMVNTPGANFGWMFYMSSETDPHAKEFKFASSYNTVSGSHPVLDIVYCNHLTVNAYVSPATTATTANAGVVLGVTNGVPPYTYSWTNTATTRDLFNILPGLYNVTITDARGVKTTVMVPVTTDCGTITYTLQADKNNYPGSYKNVQVNYSMLDDGAANKNVPHASQIQAYNTSPGASSVSIGRSLIAFDIRALPNNLQVNSASLQLTNVHSAYSSTFQVKLARNIGDWNENTATYNAEPTFDLTNPVVFSYDATQTVYSMDVTSHMQTMLSQVHSGYGWTLLLGDESGTIATPHTAAFAGGATTAPTLVMQLNYTSPFCDDTKLNWNQEDSYDENGNVIASQKNYLDYLGRSTQQLAKDATNEVFRSQTVYDSYGNPAISTMPAYTGNQLLYQPGFMRNATGQAYGLTDFDAVSTYNNAGLLQTGIMNTLGYYYSDNNTYDANQAKADNPFSRTKYRADPNGAAFSVSKPGNAYKPGSGRESYSFSMTSGDELKFVFGTITGSPLQYYSYKVKRNSTNYMDCAPIVVSEPILASKQVVITPDNGEIITYSIGGKVVASCYAGMGTSSCGAMTSINNTLSYLGTRSTDIHLPDANKTTLQLPLPYQSNGAQTPTTGITYAITDLYTNKLLVPGTDYSINGSRMVVFTSSYLTAYTGKSLILRISFAYTAAYESSVLSSSLTPVDAIANYALSYKHFSKNYYDLAGSLRRSVSGKGFNCSSPNSPVMSTTYDYSHKGQLIARLSPDQGLVEMAYDTEGKLRFTQNADQKIGHRFSYMNYDKHGRPIESGENQSSNSGGAFSYSYWFCNYYGINDLYTAYHTKDILDQSDGLMVSEKTNTTITGYTQPSSTYDIPSAWTYYSSYHSFRNGQINYIKNQNSTVWFNYDAVDRKKSTVTQITDPDFVAKRPLLADQIKTSESSYNYFTGLTNSSTYQAHTPTEILNYGYTYDGNYKPQMTQLNYGSSGYEKLNTRAYTKMGQLKRVVLGNNYQGLDYVYTLNGGLKAINHPALDPTFDPGHDADNYSGGTGVNKDLFGEIIEYYYNDYERANTQMGTASALSSNKYNGLIYGVRYKTRDKVNTQVTGSSYIDNGTTQLTILSATNYSLQELRSTYTYDELNRLGTATFGTYNNASGTYTAFSEYKESGPGGTNPISYDENGNITGLLRKAYKNSGGTTLSLDDLTYTIGSANNQLTGIVDAAGAPIGQNFSTPSTISPSSFNYNSIGQMTMSTAENVSKIDYYPTGKIKKVIFSNGDTTKYVYGAGGEKLKSIYYQMASNKRKYTWTVGPYRYGYDESATTPTFAIVEAKVPGGLLRVASGTDINTGYMVYEITDHLGNVRATFKGNGTTNHIDILSFNDYYAFGGVLPGRKWVLENDRYGYQGKEKPEDGTVWDQFDLRVFNHDLGRWFSPDPYGQFASPYLAMANNPVSNTDPDGGQVPIFDPKNPPPGMREQQRERDTQTGAYSPDEVQKRYDEELGQLKTHYLSNNYGRHADIDGYENSVYQLNDFYAGLASSFLWKNSIMYSDGFQGLTQAEMGRHIAACQRTGSQAFGLNMTAGTRRMMEEAGRSGNSTMEWAIGMRENPSDHGGAGVMSSGKQQANPPPEEKTESQEAFDQTGETEEVCEGGLSEKEQARRDAELNEIGSLYADNKATGIAGEEENGPPTKGKNSYMAGAIIISAGLAADDVTIIGCADDLLIPVLLTSAVMLDNLVGTNEKQTSDRPKLTTTFQPVGESPLNNTPGGIQDPKNPKDLGTAAWLMGGGLTYKIIQNLTKTTNNFNYNFNQTKQDNTYVYPKYLPVKNN